MLKLKFDPKLDFQIDSICSVVDLFKGQTKKPFDYTFLPVPLARQTGQIVPNLLDLLNERIFENLQEIQNLLLLLRILIVLKRSGEIYV